MSTLLEAIEARYGSDHRNADGDTPGAFVAEAEVRATLSDLDFEVPGAYAWAFAQTRTAKAVAA